MKVHYVGVFIPGMSDPVALFMGGWTGDPHAGVPVSSPQDSLAVLWARQHLVHYEVRDCWFEDVPLRLWRSSPWKGAGASR
jgi:hypothetical protein